MECHWLPSIKPSLSIFITFGWTTSIELFDDTNVSKLLIDSNRDILIDSMSVIFESKTSHTETNSTMIILEFACNDSLN